MNLVSSLLTLGIFHTFIVNSEHAFVCLNVTECVSLDFTLFAWMLQNLFVCLDFTLFGWMLRNLFVCLDFTSILQEVSWSGGGVLTFSVATIHSCSLE